MTILGSESALTPLPEQIADALPALICYVSADRKYRYMNAAYAAWFGVDQANACGRSVAEVLGPEAYARVCPLVDAALAGEARRFQTIAPYRNEGWRRIEARYVPDWAEDGSVRGYYAVVLDLSGDDARRRLEEMIDVFEDTFYAVDPDWRITYANRAAEAFNQDKRVPLVGRDLWPTTHIARGGPMEQLLRRVMTEREPGMIEIGAASKPGATLIVRAFPAGRGIGVSVRDVTEERKIQQREREQAARLELVLGASGMGNWTWDQLTGATELSPRAAEIHQATAGIPIASEDFQALIHPEDRHIPGEAMEQAIASNSVHEVEYRLAPREGEPDRWVLWRGQPRFGHDGKLLGLLGVLADITQAKAAEQRMKADQERYAALDRRQTFLLKLTDVLQELEDPSEMMLQAAERLGRFLGVGRCGYGEVDADSARIIAYAEWTDGRMVRRKSVDPRIDRLSPELLSILQRGEVLRLDDIERRPTISADLDLYRNIGVRASLVAPRLKQGKLDAILFLHHAQPYAWTDEDVFVLQDVAARTSSALGRVRSERALRESEARFRAMADSAPAPVWVTHANGPIEFVNQPFADLIGKPAKELLGDTWLELLHPDDFATVGAQRAAARAILQPYTFEARFRVADGGWRWMRAASRPRFDEAGMFQGYVGIAVDVTEARAAEERQTLLINELNHRVKNTLATVQSLAHQTLRDGLVTREARDRFTERLLALSAAHNVLTRENWEGADIARIAADAARVYDDPTRVRIALQGPSARVAPNVALALAMALHELATNAVKYGALSIPQGQVSISWTLGERGEAAELEWRETGGPAVTAPMRLGFGSRLLRQGLTAELGAPALVEYAASGVVCRLRAPLASEA